MKKILAILLALSICLSLCACGSGSADNTDNTGETGPMQVDKGLLTTNITLPASLFSDMTEEEIHAAAAEAGYSDCRINADGSVTYTMTNAVYKEKLEEMKESCQQSAAEMLEGENAVASFKRIEYNDDFSKFDIYVDSEQFTMWDTFANFTFYISGVYYQLFSGKDMDDVDVTVQYIDDATGEVLESGSYRQYMSNLEDAADSYETESSSPETVVPETTVPETTVPESTAKQDPSADGDGLGYTEITLQQASEKTDVFEFSVESIAIGDEVIPPCAGESCTYYEAENGKTYVDVCIRYTNLGDSARSVSELQQAILLFGGTYIYNGFTVAEKNDRSDFTYANITQIEPGSTEYFHFLFEVPQELEESSAALKMMLYADGNVYMLPVREGNDHYSPDLSEDGSEITEGKILTGDTVRIPGVCEFNVDFCSITDQVLPPQHGEWYSYYKASEGKVYIDFCIAYRNLSCTPTEADTILRAKLTYAGTTEYTGFTVIEENNRSDITYTSITDIAPLATEYLHCLFEVPEEVTQNDKTIEITFTIGENTYTYQLQ